MDTENTTVDPQSPANTGNDVDTSLDTVSNVDEVGDTTQTQSQDAPLDTQDDQRERTRLGRRLSAYEQEIQNLKGQVGYLASQLGKQDTGPVDDVPPVQYITTPKDLEEYEAWKVKKQQRERDAYVNSYLLTIRNLSGASEFHNEIEQELTTNVGEYPAYSGWKDAAADARTNYFRAEAKIAKQMKAGTFTPKANVRGGVQQPTGVAANTRMASSPKPLPQLDEYSRKYLKEMGIAEDSEFVRNSLKGLEK